MSRLEDLPDDVVAAARVLWDFHDIGHELRPCDVGIGLGSHDIGVATTTAHLRHRGLFATLVFTGANAPTTIEAFPLCEAVQLATTRPSCLRTWPAAAERVDTLMIATAVHRMA